jgi:hypothetical protein
MGNEEAMMGKSIEKEKKDISKSNLGLSRQLFCICQSHE